MREEEIYEQNKNLVYKILHHHQIHIHHHLWEDCYQAGSLALINAIRTYDSSKAQFITWAYLKIREGVQREIGRANVLSYKSMGVAINHSKKQQILSLDYIHASKQDSKFDLYDILVKSEVGPNYTEEQYSMAIDAIERAHLNENEMKALKGFANGDADFRKCVYFNNYSKYSLALKKIRRKLKNVYGFEKDKKEDRWRRVNGRRVKEIVRVNR